MRILMTCDTIGGVWTYALELCRAFEEHGGIEITLATMGKKLNQAQWKEAERISCAQVRESEFQLEWMDEPWVEVDAAGTWLLELERQLDPDVIHLNGYAHGALRWSAPTLVVCHSCVMSWWAAVKREPAPLEIWGTYCERVKRGLHLADHVVAPSNAMLASVKTIYGELRAATSVIPNGRNAALFCAKEKQPYIFSAGRLWDQAKNTAMLDRIASRISWPIYLAGGTNAPSRHSQTRAQSAAICLGRISSQQMSDWLSCASIYCLPARYEPFGLSILEAALSGCALALGDIPSLREFWDDAAIFVSPDDDDALVSILNGLIEDQHLRQDYAQRAKKRSLEYSHARMAHRYLEVYREMIDQRARQRMWNGVTCAS
jgi:glycogen(starch) synthase